MDVPIAHTFPTTSKRSARGWQLRRRAVRTGRRASSNPHYCNDYAGILHDMLYMSLVHYQFHGHTARLFQVIIKGAGRKSLYTFKLVCHPGDSGEPVMTMMLPEED